MIEIWGRKSQEQVCEKVIFRLELHFDSEVSIWETENQEYHRIWIQALVVSLPIFLIYNEQGFLYASSFVLIGLC